MFESIEDGSDCVDHVVKDNKLPGGALCIEQSWRMKELESFLEDGFAQLRLTKQ